MKRLIAAALAACMLAVLAGCNTIEGMGQDIQKAGDSIENAAKKNK